MLKIRAKKSGRWAVENEPALPQVSMIEGQEYNENQISASMMEMLVDKEFASWVDGSEDLDDDQDTGDGLDDTGDGADGDQGEGSDDSDDTGDGDSGGDDIRAILQAIADGADNKNDAKAKLEAWGKENLTFDVDKRKSLESVIDILVQEHSNQNG
jgi:hypothetical protein